MHRLDRSLRLRDALNTKGAESGRSLRAHFKQVEVCQGQDPLILPSQRDSGPARRLNDEHSFPADRHADGAAATLLSQKPQLTARRWSSRAEWQYLQQTKGLALCVMRPRSMGDRKRSTTAENAAATRVCDKQSNARCLPRDETEMRQKNMS
jgi:hypothetical protein